MRNPFGRLQLPKLDVRPVRTMVNRPFFSRKVQSPNDERNAATDGELRLGPNEYLRTGEYRLASWLALGGL